MKKALVISYILLICTFSYLPKSISTICFLLYMFWAMHYVWINRKAITTTIALDIETKKLKKSFVVFLFISIFYFIVSFLNLPQLWNIDGLLYNVKYLPRHFVIITELFIPIALGYAISRLKVFSHLNVFIMVCLYLFLYVTNQSISIKGLLLILLSLVAWKWNSKLLMVLTFTIFYEQTAYILGSIAVVFLLFLEKYVIAFFSTHTYRKIIITFLISIISIFLLSGIIIYYVENDANSLWRLNVWINELDSLYQTYFSGVGYGSAYVTEDIEYQVENSSMYANSDKGGMETGVFLVANHSSLLNMFYRMGVAGGFAFLAINIQLAYIVFKTYQQANKKMRNLLWRLFTVWIYETIIICLNPGLEMMQFAISYLLSIALLLAVIIDIKKQNKSSYHETTQELSIET